MSPGAHPGPRALNRQIFGKIMENAVPLDPIGDQRINELLSQLRAERDRRAGKGEGPRDARRD